MPSSILLAEFAAAAALFRACCNIKCSLVAMRSFPHLNATFSARRRLASFASSQALHLLHFTAASRLLLPFCIPQVSACALELYNEDLRDLSISRDDRHPPPLKLQERPGRDGRIVPEVVGIQDVPFTDANSLLKFFNDCSISRSTSCTKLNDTSSRSHAIFTITIRQTRVSVEEDNSKLRTMEVVSKFHLVSGWMGGDRVSWYTRAERYSCVGRAGRRFVRFAAPPKPPFPSPSVFV